MTLGEVSSHGGVAAGFVAGDLVVNASAVPDMATRSVGAAAGRVPADSELFVGRSTELERLAAAVERAGRAVVVAVHGLGGIGKSTLTARFAHVNTDRFGFVWWVMADSPTAIETGMAELAVAVAAECADLPADQRAELGTRWLATHDGWLLVLDNLTAAADVGPLLERVRTGTIIITSRQATGWAAFAETVPLDVLAPAEAVELLTRTVRAEWPDADLAAADRLCEELGYLPLAIEQAAAYLSQTRVTPTAYLDLLARFPARLYTSTRERGDAQRTMARVWHVTLNHLADTPLAGQVLRQLAWYAPDNIPRAFLAGTADEPDLLEALGKLAAYSMITLTADTISVHRLVQAVTRTPDPSDPHRLPEDTTTARDATIAALVSALDDLDPRLPANWPAHQAVLPHANALHRHIRPDDHTESLARLLGCVGIYLAYQGPTTTPLAYLELAHDINQTRLGSNHPDTLSLLNNLASVYLKAGAVGRAIPLFEAILAEHERTAGPDDPETLVSRNNLASAYFDAGDLMRAIPLYEATLADAERIHGPDDPSTLTWRSNLAHAYVRAGDLERGIPLLEASVAARERVLGSDDPGTMISRNNLANTYLSAGDVDRAMSLHKANLIDRERVLGPDNPQTLGSRNNLATTYESAGDLKRASQMHKSTLADLERVLGPDHPDTLMSRNNLANTYRMAGNLKRAIPMLETALADTARVHGPDHPTTLTWRNNLASAYGAAGDVDRAISLYEAAHATSERALGPDHEVTKLLRSNLDKAKQV